LGKIPVLTLIIPWSFFAFLHLRAGNRNLKFFIPRENSRKVQPCCPKRLLMWANTWWAAFKGKKISKLPYARRIQGHFLGPFLAARCVSSISTSYSVHQERSHHILVLIDDWIRTHNCHERPCHPKKVSFAAQQQPVVFTSVAFGC